MSQEYFLIQRSLSFPFPVRFVSWNLKQTQKLLTTIIHTLQFITDQRVWRHRIVSTSLPVLLFKKKNLFPSLSYKPWHLKHGNQIKNKILYLFIISFTEASLVAMPGPPWGRHIQHCQNENHMHGTIWVRWYLERVDIYLQFVAQEKCKNKHRANLLLS